LFSGIDSERARFLLERHPRLYSAVTNPTPFAMEQYNVALIFPHRPNKSRIFSKSGGNTWAALKPTGLSTFIITGRYRYIIWITPVIDYWIALRKHAMSKT